MTKILKALEAAGWVETTLGECQVGEEVLLIPTGPFDRTMRVTRTAEWGGEKRRFVNTSDGGARLGTLPVLREPRLEHPEGAVALVEQEGRTDGPVTGVWAYGGWMTARGHLMNATVRRVICRPDGVIITEALGLTNDKENTDD